MSNETNNKNVPELRFPEFRGEGEWKPEKLGEVGYITTGSSNREDSLLNGEYTFFDRSKDIRTSDRYLFDSEAVIVAGEGQNFIPKYFKGKFDLHQRTYAIMDMKNVVGKFIYYYLFRYRCYFFNQAVGSTVKSLRLPMFTNMPIFLTALTEQQKIADCLCSIDELITTQTQKLDKLKAHKKGLMQKIFSQAIRFKADDTSGQPLLPDGNSPSGSDFPDWEEKKLGDIGSFYRGHSYNSTNVKDDGLLVLRSSNIKNDSLVLDRDLQFVDRDCPDNISLIADDIVICMANGSKRLVGKSGVYHGDYDKKLTVGAFCSIFRTDNLLSKYIFQIVQYRKYLHILLAGTNINNLKSSELAELKFNLPVSSIEQTKIADFLSSIDTLITIQTQKIDTLKRHKKGLMQQLFPSGQGVQ